MDCRVGAEESEGAVSGHWGRHTVRSQWGGPDSSRENPRGQLSGRIEEKSEKKKRYCGAPDRVLSRSDRRDPVQGGTGAKRGKPRARCLWTGRSRRWVTVPHLDPGCRETQPRIRSSGEGHPKASWTGMSAVR